MKKKKYNPQLCPICKKGRDSYLMDNHSPFCPYLHYHNGKTCSRFEELKKSKFNITIDE
ncbi:hypothetical protein [Ructibacterium gallinarum]|uniref:Uncharacterized protein n=1 Tax=Ructibacterium gallinarum TaxID=2779355 RepID=A0A9D5R8L9_9FIRM|nr:hypothetical protein [Ructibacterium gallinarum]MBE5040556.1 hypothetical protein [Ructibacterium gallinarum]